MKEYLLTGPSGWLGKRLIKAATGGLNDYPEIVDNGFVGKVRCLTLPHELAALNGFKTNPNVDICTGDLLNPQDCARFVSGRSNATLIHTAGIIHPAKISDLYRVNVAGTRNILTAAVANKIKRVVVVSSNSPFGCNPHATHRFDENSPYNPYMNYGKSKMEMEILVNEFNKRGDIETVIIRPTWFYGPDQPARQSLFFSMVRKGKFPIVGDGNNMRSMTYIDHLCYALLLAATHQKAAGNHYWVSDETPYSMNQIIGEIQRLLRDEFKLPCAEKQIRIPGIVGDIAQWADWTMQTMGLYNQKIHVLSEMNKHIACSIDKIKSDLGFVAKVSLAAGMRHSIQWCLDNHVEI